MGHISVTFADAENGVMTSSFNFPEPDMKRMMSVLKASYQNLAQQQFDRDTQDYKDWLEQREAEGPQEDEPPEPPKLYEYTAKTVTEVLSEAMVQNIIDQVIENERMILYRQMDIKPIMLKKT